MKSPYEIQTIVLACTRAAKVDRVQELGRVAWGVESLDPDEVPDREGSANAFRVRFIATFEEFMKFRECVNADGVWLADVDYERQRGSVKYVYTVIAVDTESRT
jgi:hypothetical protein